MTDDFRPRKKSAGVYFNTGDKRGSMLAVMEDKGSESRKLRDAILVAQQAFVKAYWGTDSDEETA
jgi:hypothetical protein